jgi:DNA-binding response OmpR family regulator
MTGGHQRTVTGHDPERAVGPAGPATEPIWVVLLSDDSQSRQALAHELRMHDFRVTDAPRSVDIEHTLQSVHCDVTIIDVEPHARAYQELLATIARRLPEHPVMLVGRDAQVADRVSGLNAGAVDFVAKPLSVRELAARIRARIRFDRGEQAVLRHGGIEVDMPARSVRHRGISLHVSNLEFRLLAYFLRNVGKVRTREEILGEVWRSELSCSSNAVDVYVGYLRRKLARQGCQLPLTTVRGQGYRLEPE